MIGLILVGLATPTYIEALSTIEGPPEEKLVRVSAVFVEGHCSAMRTGSYGAAQSSVRGRPDVKYKYIFNGVEYAGHRFIRQRNTPIGSMDQCLEYVESLRSANSIDCWADPLNPEFAVLSKQLRGLVLENIWLAIAAVLIALGVRGLWLSRNVKGTAGDEK